MAKWDIPLKDNRVVADLEAIQEALNALLRLNPEYGTAADIPSDSIRVTKLANNSYQFQKYNGTKWVSLGIFTHDLHGTADNSLTLNGYTTNAGTDANTIPVRDANGRLPGDITGTSETAKTLATNLPIEKGGTGATSVVQARENLGLSLPLSIEKGGTGAIDAINALKALGLEIPVEVKHGGTGAITPAEARTNLGINLPLPIENGGTGGTTVAEVLANLRIPLPIKIAQGGTGAIDLVGAKKNLEIPTVVYPIAIDKGGTGGTSREEALTNLGINIPLDISQGGTSGTTGIEASIALGLKNVENTLIGNSTGVSNYSTDITAYPFIAGANLTGKEGYAVSLNSSGKIVTDFSDNQSIIGILKTGATANQTCYVYVNRGSIIHIRVDTNTIADQYPAGTLLGIDTTGKIATYTLDSELQFIGIVLESKHSISGGTATQGTAVITSNGKTLFRHPANIGTVLSYETEGVTFSYTVLDAKYRTSAKFGSLNTLATSLVDGSNFNLTTSMTSADLDGGAKDYPVDLPDNSLPKTEQLAYSQNIFDAASYCHGLLLLETPSALPTISLLMRIWQVKGTLDTLDPTLTAYPNYSLNTWSFDGSANAAMWSCSEYDSTVVWTITNSGLVYGTKKNVMLGVIPVKEYNPSRDYIEEDLRVPRLKVLFIPGSIGSGGNSKGGIYGAYTTNISTFNVDSVPDGAFVTVIRNT